MGTRAAEFSAKDSCPHARVLIHNASGLIHTRIEYADTLDFTVINDGAYDGQNSFRASLRREVENDISAEQFLSATCIGRIRVEYLSGLILVEDADAGKFIDRGVDQLVIVVHLTPSEVFLRERDMVVKVEVAAIGRHPLEAPAHAFLERFDLCQRCSRDRDIRYVVVFEMHQSPFDMVHLERAADAALLPFGAEHEMLDDQLTPAAEEVRECLFAVRPLKDIIFLDLHPGQLATFPTHLVAQPG